MQVGAAEIMNKEVVLLLQVVILKVALCLMFWEELVAEDRC